MYGLGEYIEELENRPGKGIWPHRLKLFPNQLEIRPFFQGVIIFAG
jgi:hypothetical protein